MTFVDLSRIEIIVQRIMKNYKLWHIRFTQRWLKMVVFWDVTPCTLRYGVSFYLQTRYRQKWRNKVLQNLGQYVAWHLVAEHKQPLGPPAVWRDFCHSSLLLLPVSLQKWQLQSCGRIRYLEILFGIVFTTFMAYVDE